VLASPELNQFVETFVVNKDNIDFYWSLVELWLNVTSLSEEKIKILSQRI
jgi:predicted HicB family RNase H-like nuclease